MSINSHAKVMAHQILFRLEHQIGLRHYKKFLAGVEERCFGTWMKFDDLVKNRMGRRH